ncbi:MAG: tetratricopeptide repeat protein [Planctomycetes bacterium]|nr:tetratricopeptide repeat protein [Planctomycetota bacterium]
MGGPTCASESPAVPGARRGVAWVWLAGAALALGGCGSVREAIPFMPPSQYVDVGGRKLTREEVKWSQDVRELGNAVRVNPKDSVSYVSMGELFQNKGHYELASQLYVEAIKIDPNLDTAHYNLGVLAIHEENWKDALQHLSNAQKLSPMDAKIMHRMGQAQDGLGNSGEAVKAYDQALKLDPEYTPAYLDKAKCLYRVKRYKEAEDVCRKAIANVPKKLPNAKAGDDRSELLKMIWPGGEPEVRPDTALEEAQFDLALCLKAQGRLREALEALAPIEKTVYPHMDVQLMKSQLQEASGDRAGAIVTLEALRKEFGDTAEIPRALARLYQVSGQADLAAKTRLDAAELDQSDRGLQLEAAKDALARKDFPRQVAVYERLVRIDPSDLDARRALAKAYDDLGIDREAALTYQEVVNRAPEDIVTRRRLGILYSDLPGFQGRAMLQFKTVLEKNPNDAEVHRKMGELYFGTRNVAEAENHLRKALQLDPKDARGHAVLGDLLVVQKRGEDAVAEYKKSLELDPKLVGANYAMARTLVSVDRREDAVKPMEAYLKDKPDDVEARKFYADTLRDLNRREDAVKQYNTIAELRPRDPSNAMEIARLASLLGQRSDAAGLYESIIEKNPADVNALRAAARIYDESKQTLRAMFCWQRLLRIKPSDEEGLASLAANYKSIGEDEAAIKCYETLGHADAWRHIAFLRMKRGEKDKAMAAFRKVIELQKADVDARSALAGLLQHTGKDEDRDQAVALYQELLLINEKDLKARLNLANLLSECNRYAEAQEHYEYVLRQDAGNVGAHVGLGVIMRKRGRIKDAQDHYEAAVKADPNSKLAHYNLGVLYDYYLEDTAKAKEHYDAFVRLGGDAALLEDKADADAKKEGAKPAPKDVKLEPKKDTKEASGGKDEKKPAMSTTQEPKAE